MNLKKLELFGFKSFMRKLDIHFSDGITVIVGPNGCGKTNVTDAIRWVLGESNARALRGNRMEDLIFNGTRDYKPLNVAEVGLTVDNSSGILPIDYAEVTVTRRVYRDGESEFLINKVPGLLRDIQELFMGTGLGSRAYSVIERDMVEMVLAEQPEKRRELIEEAAGIMKYKIRERQARRKLEATDDDLQRISDVLREVERQVRSLKRQVGAAKRFQEIRDRARELEVGLALVELETMDREAKRLGETLIEHGTEREGAAGRVAALEADIESLRVESARADGALSSVQREVDERAEMARQVENENLVRGERRESLLATAGRLSEEKAELADRIRRGAERRVALEEEREERERELAGVRDRLAEEEESLARLQSDLEIRHTELSRAREAVEEAAARAGELRAGQASLEARVEHLADRDAVLAEEEKVLEQTVETLRAELAESSGRVAALREDLGGHDRELDAALARRDEIDADRESLREEESGFAVEEESARSALDMLRALQANREGYGQGARALLGRAGETRLTALADSIRVTRPDLLPALDAALEGAVEYLVAPSAAEAMKAIRFLKDGKGRVTLVDLEGFRESSGTREKYSLPSDPAILGTARSFLEVSGDLSPVLDDILSRTLIVETLEDAVRFARRAEARDFRFVTREGDWARHPGIVHGGAPASAAARILGRADRVAGLERRVAEAEENRRRTRERAESLSAERESLVVRTERSRTRRDEVRESLVLEERNVERIRAEIAASEARGEAVRVERETLAAQREEVARERERRAAALVEAEERRRRLESDWRRRESEVVDSSSVRDRAQGACHDLQLESQRIRGEAEKVALEISRLEEACRADEEGIARREEELQRTDRTVGQLARELEQGRSEFARRVGELEDRRRLRDDVARDRTRILERLRELEQERNRWSGLRDQSAQLVHETEMRLAKLESSREELISRTEREFEVNLGLAGAREAHGSLLGSSPESLEAARRELEGLRRQIDRMGAVNLVALEQYERESKRCEFLRTQKEDLEEAREKLRRTIRKINRTARTLFMGTLDEVRRNFQQTFGTLFEGGQADIRLVGDEDPLQAPIEIFARPRGKRLGSISLLSSGERSLTAVAFLFAIYLVKPSPFCILDEVDAPLDDANIGRFLSMLRKVARKTQFVMITHNKRTMEIADYLYGVTMQEPGISQLVSVRLGPDGETPPAPEEASGNGAEVTPEAEALVMEGSA